MKVVYIAGPYRDPRGEWFVRFNIRQAEILAIAIWQMGAVAVCPHKNTSGFGGTCPDDVWLEGDLELVKRSDAVLMVFGWGRSKGATAERAFALDRGMPVFESLVELQDWLAT